MKVIKIPIELNKSCTIHEVNESDCLDQIKKLIGIEWAEIVVIHTRPTNPRRDFCLIVDKVGKLKVDWRINFRASQFYPGTPFGDPIAGNVILCTREWTDSFGECDLAGLTDEEIKIFEKYL